MKIMLGVSVVLIMLNAMFVLLEFALVRVRASRIEVLARRGNQRAVRAQYILNHLDIYLAALQLGITVVSLALGWIGEPVLAEIVMRVFEHLPFAVPPNVTHGLSFAFALMLLSVVHIIFGELVPRSIGIQRA